MRLSISLDLEKIKDFCRRWKISEFSLFGSVLREDFGPESDVDVLISFEPEIPWSLFDWMDMTEELQEILGREVNVVEKSGLRNPFRRHAILTTRRVIYAPL
jgi:predicted nucleotidyltransferase